jgi:hypothetical protein
MKLIKLNESQYKRLFEIDSFVQGAGGENQSSIPDKQTQDETWTTSTIDKGDEGNEKGTPPGLFGRDPRAKLFSPPTKRSCGGTTFGGI